MATDLTQIELKQTIAKGGQSVVILGHIKGSFESVAVKRVSINSQGRKNAVSNEIGALSRLPWHRNIVAYRGSHVVKRKAYIVLEYLPFPTLSTYLSQNGAMSTMEALFVTRQILEAVRFMKQHSVAHRDLKSDNILINPKTLQIKLVDFGLSSPVTDHSIDDLPVGTPIYMSPSAAACHAAPAAYSVLSSELWSVGMLLWEMLLGTHPYDDAKDLKELIVRQKVATFEIRNSKLSSMAKPILVRLLRTKDEERCTLTEAVALVRSVAPRHSPLRDLDVDFYSGSSSMGTSTGSNADDKDSEAELSRSSHRAYRNLLSTRGSISMLSKSSSPRLEQSLSLSESLGLNVDN